MSDWSLGKERQLKRLLFEQETRKCRRSLLDFVRWTFPEYKVGRHILEIAEALEAVERGEIRRLIINCPPRHGKSLLVSQRFPAWYMGRNPNSQMIHAAYGGDLVSDFGRDLRNLMLGDSYRDIFPGVEIATDSKAADKWHTTRGGVYIAAGVGGAITGRGANLLLIDDPVKGREEADSQRMRDRAWHWYLNDAYTRLMPNASIVVIQTRWHEDDLTGRILANSKMGGDRWDIINFPAISPEGRALWPEFWPLERLEPIRREMSMSDPRAWQSLYMGDPNPDEGVYFERPWFHRGTPPDPALMKFYGASDYAVTDRGGDWTVHGVVGIDHMDRMWLMDLWRKQTDSGKWVDPMLDMMRKWRPIRWAEEGAQIEKAVGPWIVKRMMERKVYCHRIQFSSGSDKPAKARSIQGRISMKGLWLPSYAHWADTVESELLKFPYGVHDDIVDVLGLIGKMVAGLEQGRPQPHAEAPAAEGRISMDQLFELEQRRMGRL